MIENVILITIDSLRAGHLGCYGYYKKITPKLDELAENGIIFTHAFSNGPQTTASFPSILTSTYPLMYEMSKQHLSKYRIMIQHLSKHRIMISEVLREAGYSTAGVNCNVHISSYYGYNRDFEYFRDFFEDYSRMPTQKVIKFGNRAKVLISIMEKKINKVFSDSSIIYKSIRRFYSEIWGRTQEKKFLESIVKLKNINAAVINKEAISWLKNKENNKFFLWIHYMDVHFPYLPSSKYINYNKREVISLNRKIIKHCIKGNRADISESELKQIIKLYDVEIGYVDNSVALFLDEVEKLGLLSNTLIIITADHGDEFLEHGDTFHFQKLYDELLHVPLIFYAPELGEKKVIDDLVSLLDLSPTILDILGIEKPKKWLGESLLPLIKGDKRRTNNAVTSEVSCSNCKRKISYRMKKWKLIWDEERDFYELYDLEKDSKEIKNIAEEKPDIVKYLSSKIKEHVSMEDKTRRQAEEKKITGMLEKLKTGGGI
jgi:arylsulfatase A-like enzyme